MLPALSALVTLQQLDTAADGHRKRINEIPAAERAIEARVQTAAAALNAHKAELAANQQGRRELEKQVAQVDGRLARFDDHRAAVKTNQEYTALLHEISTAKNEKDAIEEKILGLLEAADAIAAEIAQAEVVLAEARSVAAKELAALSSERARAQAEIERLARERSQHVPLVDARSLTVYEQLLKNRKGIAVARIDGELCTACHVRMRPHVAQTVRRNDSIVQCDSCQRILFFEAKVPV